MPRKLGPEEFKQLLRTQRKKVCFPVINRGKLWYECLSNEQLVELKTWYHDWLNVTETLVIPVAPTWLNKKLEEEEILL